MMLRAFAPGFPFLLLASMPVALGEPPPVAAPPPPAEVNTDDAPAPAPPPRADLGALERAFRAERDDRKRGRLAQEMAALPGSGELLARIVESDPSDDVALAATYALRRVELGALVRALERRLDGSGNRDAAARERLLREIERHQVFAAGQNLPHFVREAPPVFAAKGTEHRHVRVLAFGDFGDGSERQQRMAGAMRRLHEQKRFDFAVTLGDNFYPAGMSGPADPRWERDFARLYGPMRIRFFGALGNHDWILADSPASEIAHSDRSDSWRMPADRYTFVAGPAQFFAIDTDLLSRAQLDWLDRELGRSTARWKIVYGHHPIYSYGIHGDEAAVRDSVLPILRGRANLYLCGHDHDLQHIAPEDGVHFVVAGGGGAQPRPTLGGPRSLFSASQNGFAVIEASHHTLEVSLVGEDLQTLHKFTVSTSDRDPARRHGEGPGSRSVDP
jgi:hypothetical protein